MIDTALCPNSLGWQSIAFTYKLLSFSHHTTVYSSGLPCICMVVLSPCSVLQWI